jgi:hydrogenase maturation protease
MIDIAVIGIGSDLRGDDGAGLEVARRLRGQVSERVRIIEHLGDGTALISAWQDANRVIVVDAVKSGAKPGTIFRFDSPYLSFPEQISFTSSHDFGLEEALKLATQLDQMPKSLVIYVIEGGSYALGEGLTTEVEVAVESVIKQIFEDVAL